jgi:hypothetical protein
MKEEETMSTIYSPRDKGQHRLETDRTPSLTRRPFITAVVPFQISTVYCLGSYVGYSGSVACVEWVL